MAIPILFEKISERKNDVSKCTPNELLDLKCSFIRSMISEVFGNWLFLYELKPSFNIRFEFSSDPYNSRLAEQIIVSDEKNDSNDGKTDIL